MLFLTCDVDIPFCREICLFEVAKFWKKLGLVVVVVALSVFLFHPNVVLNNKTKAG